WAEAAKASAETKKDSAEQVLNDVNATDEAKRKATVERDAAQRKLDESTQRINDLTASREADVLAKKNELETALTTQTQAQITNLRAQATAEKRVAELERGQKRQRDENAEQARRAEDA